MGEERGSHQIPAQRKKVVIEKDFGHKKDFDHQKVSYDEGGYDYVFVYLENTNKNRYKLKKIFFIMDFGFWTVF